MFLCILAYEKYFLSPFSFFFNLCPPHFSPSQLNKVRPSKLPNLHISDGKVFSWDYPDTWEKPCSFFGLQFEVKLVHSGHPCNSDNQIIVINTRTSIHQIHISLLMSSLVEVSLSLLSRLFFVQNITTDTTKYEVGVKTKKYVFCVRAQDKFTRGPWSHWSQCT